MNCHHLDPKRCKMCRLHTTTHRLLEQTKRSCPPWYEPPQGVIGADIPAYSVRPAFNQMKRCLGNVSSVCHEFHAHNRRKQSAREAKHCYTYHSNSSPQSDEHVVLDLPPGTFEVVARSGHLRSKPFLVSLRPGESIDVRFDV
eukprot:m.91038 g.91038  ORF g.91038 m.91038 type:complete len:143 (-) comp21617_c1_seq1:165-593(-)